MAQWGSERSFLTKDFYIRVIPDVDTGSDAFAPLVEDATIDDLILILVTGPMEQVRPFMQELKTRYVGKSYSEWLADAR